MQVRLAGYFQRITAGMEPRELNELADVLFSMAAKFKAEAGNALPKAEPEPPPQPAREATARRKRRRKASAA